MSAGYHVWLYITKGDTNYHRIRLEAAVDHGRELFVDQLLVGDTEYNRLGLLKKEPKHRH